MTTAFYLAASVAVAATFLVVISRNAIHGLLYFILSLCSVAVVFFVLGAPFIAALEIIVYAGAIMVLFVFVVMMLDVRSLENERENGKRMRSWIGPGLLSVAILAELVIVASGTLNEEGSRAVIEPVETGRVLFTTYFIGIELASVLLLAGLVGAFHLGRRSDAGGPDSEKTISGAKEVKYGSGSH